MHGYSSFHYKGYQYWFSVIDCCFYKQKDGYFDKIIITGDEFYKASENELISCIIRR